MRILMVHNRYRQRGGEDGIFVGEAALLQEHGHDVATWEEHNEGLNEGSRVGAAIETIWSFSGQKKIAELIESHRPEVVHFHNTFLRISPAAYYTCQKAGIPVVQSLHNYRLMCPAANLYRDGKICEDCLGKWGLWPSIQHRCWHSSYVQTSVVAAMLGTHRLLHTWQKQVNIYVVQTEFARQKFIDAGLPEHKIVIKPNFVATIPESQATPLECPPFALFVGRLTEEKGVDLLLKAWQSVGPIPLKIAGDGPIRADLELFVQQHGLANIEFCGMLSHDDVLELMQQARLLIVPSLWYEGFPLTILEAFSLRLPVIATHVGAIGEMVRHGDNGLRFELNDAADLAHWVRWAWEHPAEMEVIAANAYLDYQTNYTRANNYRALIDIYQRAMETPA